MSPEIIGIIGKTQGVIAKSNPKPKNVASISAIFPEPIVSAIASLSERSTGSKVFSGAFVNISFFANSRVFALSTF